MVAGFSDEVSAAWSTGAVAPGGSYCDRRVRTDIFAQCAQGKDFSRVTERVPPIFRSIEDNGSSAAISVEAGRSFRDAPSITASFLSFPRLLSVARFPLGLGLGRRFFYLFGSVAMCSLLLAQGCVSSLTLPTSSLPLPPSFWCGGY